VCSYQLRSEEKAVKNEEVKKTAQESAIKGEWEGAATRGVVALLFEKSQRGIEMNHTL